MESAFGTQVPLLHCSFLFIFLFFLASFVGLLAVNKNVGVAFTEKVFQNLQEHPLKIPVPFRPITEGTAAEVKARMWARRWRARWAARHGKLRILDEVPFAEMQNKAPVFDNMLDMVFGFVGLKSGTVFWASFRPQTCVRFCILWAKKRDRFWCQIPALKMGPRLTHLIRNPIKK